MRTVPLSYPLDAPPAKARSLTWRAVRGIVAFAALALLGGLASTAIARHQERQAQPPAALTCSNCER